MSNWTPRKMPKLRDQTCRLLADPDSGLNRVASSMGIVSLAHHELAAADLYWVTEQMAALAVSSAATLPDVRWTADDVPSPHGLIIWDGGIGTIDIGKDLYVQVAAVSWSPHPEGLKAHLYADRRLLAARAPILTEEVPPLVPIVPVLLRTGMDWRPVNELAPAYRTVLTSLSATWLLMQQPTIVDRTTAERDPKIERSYARASRPAPEVSIVDLRRRLVPEQDPAESNGEGRTYRHRWVVEGHWRQQAYGPGRTQRRPVFIEPHIKGPDGAPMLPTTRVNVWRR